MRNLIYNLWFYIIGRFVHRDRTNKLGNYIEEMAVRYWRIISAFLWLRVDLIPASTDKTDSDKSSINAARRKGCKETKADTQSNDKSNNDNNEKLKMLQSKDLSDVRLTKVLSM